MPLRNYGPPQFHPSPELSARIQARIDAIQPVSPEAGWSLGEWPTRVLKEKENALPLRGSIALYIWAIRADGMVLCLDLDTLLNAVEAETDPFHIFAALLCGARRYPELEELVPAPPAAARPCGSCGGTGERSEALAQDAMPCEACEGVGWILTGPLWRD